jgi:hypothetical protein
MLGVNRVGSRVARGLNIMMPEAIDLKFIAALLTGNQIKEGWKTSAGKVQVCREGSYRWLRVCFSAKVGSHRHVHRAWKNLSEVRENPSRW